MNNYLVSVIVPVYNVEKYIEKCVDSLIEQSYKNIEIILVDDGSNDSSPKICDAYQLKYNNIRVLHKKNGGLSDARNKGIEMSKGHYLIFVDSDDWIPKNSIEFLYNMISNNKCDIACGNILEVYTREIIEEIHDDSFYILGKSDSMKKLLYMKGITNSASGKIYKRELFNDIKFPIGKLYEDLGTTYKLFSNSDKIAFSNSIVYYYYKNNSNSIVNSKYSKRELDRLFFAKEELEYVKKNYSELENAAIYRYFYEALNIIGKIPISEKEIKNVYKIIKEYRKIVIKDSNLSFKQKVFCASSLFGIRGIKMLYIIRKWVKKKWMEMIIWKI